MTRRLTMVVLMVSLLLQNLAVVAGQETVTLYPIADNYVDSKYPELAHYGAAPTLYVGNAYDRAQDIWGFERIFIRFNLTELPKDQVITRATLVLWQFYAPKSNQTYEAHRVLGDWNETAQNWNNQPSWVPESTSVAIAPDRRDVPVEWDITADVKEWYSGRVPNYGTMIKVLKEEHSADSSSGFWSRHYPTGSHKEWKPKLLILFQTISYTVTLNVVGLPEGAIAAITVDGKAFGSVSPATEEKITFDSGTSHRIAVSGMVPVQPGVRYRCDHNETDVSEGDSVDFTYSQEYYLNVTSPFGETEGSGWYAKDSLASFSVDQTTVPVEGFLGTLGLAHSFNRWNGSNDFLGIPVDPQGALTVKEPTTIMAVWVDDWSAVVFNVIVMLLVILIAAGAIVGVGKLRTRQRPLR